MYIDSNIFIYAAIDNGEKGERARKVVEKVLNGEVKGSVSALVIDEVIWVVQRMTDRDVAERVARLIMSMPLIWMDISYQTAKYAMKYYREGLDPRDAFHAAVMEEYGIQEILSEDRDFEKVRDIRRISLKELVDREN